jgi:hypothetical protein
MTERIWTPEEEGKLLALRAVGLKWYLVAKKLGRTEAATISRAGVLKVQRLTLENTGSPPKKTGGCDRKQKHR